MKAAATSRQEQWDYLQNANVGCSKVDFRTFGQIDRDQAEEAKARKVGKHPNYRDVYELGDWQGEEAFLEEVFAAPIDDDAVECTSQENLAEPADPRYADVGDDNAEAVRDQYWENLYDQCEGSKKSAASDDDDASLSERDSNESKAERIAPNYYQEETCRASEIGPRDGGKALNAKPRRKACWSRSFYQAPNHRQAPNHTPDPWDLWERDYQEGEVTTYQVETQLPWPMPQDLEAEEIYLEQCAEAKLPDPWELFEDEPTYSQQWQDYWDQVTDDMASAAKTLGLSTEVEIQEELQA